MLIVIDNFDLDQKFSVNSASIDQHQQFVNDFCQLMVQQDVYVNILA